MSKAVAWSDAVVSEPVTLINAFTVSPAESEPFLRRWKNNAQIMARQPGFIRARMHRSLVDHTQFQYINVAEWDSGMALDQALANPEWRANVQTFLDDPDLHFTSLPVVYQVMVDVHPGDRL